MITNTIKRVKHDKSNFDTVQYLCVVTAIRGRVHQNVSSQAKMIIDIRLLLCTAISSVLFLGAILHTYLVSTYLSCM